MDKLKLQLSLILKTEETDLQIKQRPRDKESMAMYMVSRSQVIVSKDKISTKVKIFLNLIFKKAICKNQFITSRIFFLKHRKKSQTRTKDRQKLSDNIGIKGQYQEQILQKYRKDTTQEEMNNKKHLISILIHKNFPSTIEGRQRLETMRKNNSKHLQLGGIGLQ